MAAANYTFQLSLGRLWPEWSRAECFASDEAAILAAEEILNAERLRSGAVQGLTLLVGRGVDDIAWLGGWHCTPQAAEWHPA